VSRIRRPSEKRARDVAFCDLAFLQGHLEGLARGLELYAGSPEAKARIVECLREDAERLEGARAVLDDR
jgi:hypothetical protein